METKANSMKSQLWKVSPGQHLLHFFWGLQTTLNCNQKSLCNHLQTSRKVASQISWRFWRTDWEANCTWWTFDSGWFQFPDGLLLWCLCSAPKIDHQCQWIYTTCKGSNAQKWSHPGLSTDPFHSPEVLCGWLWSFCFFWPFLRALYFGLLTQPNCVYKMTFFLSVDKDGGAILVLLHLSAAFDTLDHALLLQQLEHHSSRA